MDIRLPIKHIENKIFEEFVTPNLPQRMTNIALKFWNIGSQQFRQEALDVSSFEYSRELQ